MDYCSFFSCIGHSLSNCKISHKSHGKDTDHVQKIAKSTYVPVGKKSSHDDGNNIVLELIVQVNVETYPILHMIKINNSERNNVVDHGDTI